MNMSNNSHHAHHIISLQYVTWASNPVNRSLVGIMCCLSILGSITIMATFALWKELRTTSRKILLFLSISDLLLASSNLIGILLPMNDNIKHPKNPFCVTQSFLTTSFSIMSFLWTLTLAIYLYLAIVKNKQMLGKKLLPFFHIVNWLLGPIINGIALYRGMLGYATTPLTGGWCWIYHDALQDNCGKYTVSNEEIMWIFIDGKGLEVTVYTTIFVIYGVIKCKLHRELKERLKGPMEPEVLRAARSADRKLIFMPCLLMLGRLCGLTRIVLTFVSTPQLNQKLPAYHKALLSLQGMGDSSQGFLNCILFCFLNPKVYSHLKEAFLYRACCRWCAKDEDVPQTESDRESIHSEKYESFSIPEPYGEDSTLTVHRDSNTNGEVSLVGN